MLTWIKEHKKLTATIVASIAQVFAAIFPQHLDTIQGINMAILVYIGAQGAADIGKEKAKIEAGKQP